MMCKRSVSLRLVIALFTITVFSLFTFTTLRQAEALTVSNLSVASGKAYQVVNNGLQNGALVYIDSFTYISGIPASLQGATYIKTANDDKASSSATFLSFDVDEDVTVYVAHSDAIGSRPSWLSSFSDTGDDLGTPDTTLSLFSATFLAGNVTLGGNEGALYSMYSVVVVGSGGPGGSTASRCNNSWSKILTTNRFELVMGDEAVLDTETCLVWQQSPATTTKDWTTAQAHCFRSEVGGRGGWRLPTIEELTSLKDTVNTNPSLPTGHPFDTGAVQSSWYWSATTVAHNATYAWIVRFSNGNVGAKVKTSNGYVWCVRGGQGHDAY